MARTPAAPYRNKTGGMKEQNKMKKLMIAAAIVCAAAFAQAAQYTWNAQSSYILSVNASDPDWDPVAQGTPAYFVFVDAYSQSALVNDFVNDSVDMAKLGAVGTTTVNANGGISTTAAFSADYTSNQQAYFVILEDGKMFVSEETTANYAATGTSPVTFADQSLVSDWDTNGFLDAKAGYSQAGWYNVPEPTSGLLMLLGMAGLALRRKRA